MKKICAFIFLISFAMQAQRHEKACDLFSKINYVLQKRHFKPKPVDDSLSVYVFETIMDDLDENRTLFLQQEHDQLAKHKYKIDDYILKNDCSFFTDFISAYKKALERNKSYVPEIGNQPLPYYTKDTIFYSKKTFPFHTDPEKIKRFIRKKITYDILEDVAKISKDKDSLKPHLETLGKISKDKILESYLCRLDRQLNPSEGFDNSMYNLFFSTFCSYFDPHSTYFNYNEKASFVSSISTENYSLGLYVSQNEKEEIIIDELVPGGPAYLSKKINKGDQLIKLAANNVEYTVSCTSLEIITDIVLSDNYKEVQLTLRKKDGTLYSLNLEKQIMKADDNSVYSFLVGNDSNIGYIKIPSFYSAFDNETNQGCADDVAKEINKLKEDNITGLIIDLQFNGGGSMDEVIRMAGMFINLGPLAIITERDNSYKVIKDYNRGMLYDGPMVVLVNGFSASASEFFAGVMQDYNRALIVGATTVGKATMQAILPLEKNDPEDFVKVSIDKFYRVTGKSSQYIGIVPDVQLPSYFDDLLPRESSMPTAIKNDTLTLNIAFNKLPDTETKKVIALSKNRTEKNEDFNLIDVVNSRINDLYSDDKAPMPINFDTVFTDSHSMDEIWKCVSDSSEKEQEFNVTETTFAAEIPVEDDYNKSINNYKIKAVKADIYINEAINILKDINRINNH
ncbi:Tail-specific protease precursor [compost metagenome]